MGVRNTLWDHFGKCCCLFSCVEPSGPFHTKTCCFIWPMRHCLFNSHWKTIPVFLRYPISAVQKQCAWANAARQALKPWHEKTFILKTTRALYQRRRSRARAHHEYSAERHGWSIGVSRNERFWMPRRKWHQHGFMIWCLSFVTDLPIWCTLCTHLGTGRRVASWRCTRCHCHPPPSTGSTPTRNL